MGKDNGRFTESGIEIKQDEIILHAKRQRMMELPGEYPFTRGPKTHSFPFMQNQFFGLGTSNDTRGRAEFLKSIGCSQEVGRHVDEIEGNLLMPLLVAFDLPTQRGLDPDEPKARGRVGGVGVSISNIWDIGAMMDGIPLDKTIVQWNAFDGMLPVVALYCAYCIDVRKKPLTDLLMHNIQAYSLGWCHDHIGFPPRSAIKLEVDFIDYGVKNFRPDTFVNFADGYDQAEAGANAIQEVAFMLARYIHQMEECIKVGVNPDDMACRTFGHYHLSMDFFETIAKIRAIRRMWAKVNAERFGCKNQESLKHKMTITETAGKDLYANEPLNNIVRLTVMTLAGVLSGVEGIFTAAYDEPLGIPTETSAKMSVRTQQILAVETGVMNVADPLGGSHYIEWLTDKMEEEVNKVLVKIEKNGGFLNCWESGWLRAEIANSANQRQSKIDIGEKVVIGVNKFRSADRQGIPSFRVPEEAEIKAAERVKEYRAQRDNQKTQDALANLRSVAYNIENDWPKSSGTFFPALIEAARAHATLGEMHRVMRDVFGYSHYIGQGF